MNGLPQNKNSNLKGDFKTALDRMSDQSKIAQELSERERQQAGELKNKVDKILEIVNAAANGDLSKEISITGQDTIGQLGEGLKTFFADLRKNMQAIGAKCSTVGKLLRTTH